MSANSYTVPPFSGARYKVNAERAGYLDPCCICGRAVKDRSKAKYAVVIDGGVAWGDDQSDTTNPGYMGCWLVGPDCHRKFLTKQRP